MTPLLKKGGEGQAEKETTDIAVAIFLKLITKPLDPSKASYFQSEVPYLSRTYLFLNSVSLKYHCWSKC